MPDTAERRRERRRTRAAQLGAYVLIVLIGWYGFASAAAGREDARKRGDEHRQITANVVCGVAQLIRDLVTPPAAQKLTAEQKAYIASTLDRLSKFQREQLEQLDKQCQQKEKP